ncbi:acyl-homoserine-lactone synthase [Rahnella sikkimica]|uniref:Acyl-homoserine-lactone synthase n=1 Tax=Rahnella sikkimica TaxID=1805933 RepID=A0A2L1UXH4_9GAMM|nr:acyl-homoserine-lactone synthase [Rahnella sikkimica]AVF37652.1 acyl-homoserine-lactone synthase [Rahnella sikkimica]
MLEIFDVSYNDLTGKRSDDLYKLRKKTFKDRLDWAVQCTNGMEFDEFDNADTRYMLGIFDNQLVCSVRFVDLRLPNMITHTFNRLFDDVELPEGDYIESSRFFVDKNRAKELLGNRFPISHVLFLSMINYARHHGHTGIYTIVSRAMLTIAKRSGWKIEVIKEGFVSENEPIYLLRLPIDLHNQGILAKRISEQSEASLDALCEWPMSLPVTPVQV